MGNTIASMDKYVVHHLQHMSSKDLELFKNSAYCNTLLSKHLIHVSHLELPMEFKGKECDATQIIRFYIRVAQLYGILMSTLQPNGIITEHSYFKNPCMDTLVQLSKETGCLPELRDLFYDIYDPSSKDYTEISEESRTEYIALLTLFKDFMEIKEPAESFSDVSFPPRHVTFRLPNKTPKHPIEDYANQLVQLHNQQMEITTALLSIYNRIIWKDHLHPELTLDTMEEFVSEIKKLLKEQQKQCSLGISSILHKLNVVIEHETLRSIQRKLKYLQTHNFFSNTTI
jgi:hypothetical protein